MKSRKDRHGITVYIIFGSIILVFAFWGVKTVDAPRAGYAAEVNHEIVTVGEFRRAFDRQLQFYGQFMGGQFTPKGEQLVKMKESVLESLIGSKLISQAAETSGFKATDVEIREQIFAIPAFQQNGRFDRNIYKAYLEQSHLSPAEFENNLRESARLNLARSVITSVLKPSELEAKKLFTVENTKVSLDFIQVDAAQKFSHPSTAEIDAFLSTSANRVTEKYNSEKATRFTHADQIHSAHILIKAVPGKEAEAQKKIQEIAVKAKTEDFGKLAKQFSEDAGTKMNGGDLGLFSRGRMVEEFENVAFALNVGEISAPVKTNFGFHLIKVLEKQPAHIQSFESAKSQIASEMITEEKANRFNSELEKALKSSPEELENFISANKLKWENTGLFDLSASTVPKIGPAPELPTMVAALSKEKPVADRLLRYGNKAFVIRFKEQQHPKNVPNEKELDTVSQQVANARLGEIFELWQKIQSRTSTIRRNEMVLREF